MARDRIRLPDGSDTSSGIGAMERWMEFVVEHGYRARAHELARVLDRTETEVERLRKTGVCKLLAEPHSFADLFSLWHGRAPGDADWPPPRKVASGSYEWNVPELGLLASLVGRASPAEIAQILTLRLRAVTGDGRATRSRAAVQARMQHIGLQTKDVLGGITVTDAGREVNTTASVRNAIQKGELTPRRVGTLLVIPRTDWEAWKAKRTFPPAGFVKLASIRERLGIRSDKLSEFARMGFVDTAIRCNPSGAGANTQFGTWYVDPKVAVKLIADRKAGKPMPWHGKPNPDNLKVTYRLWCKRKHPPECQTCAEIWGAAGPPGTLEEYAPRYAPLAFGAKRHLTMVWSPGLTIDEVASQARRTRAEVLKAVSTGALPTWVYKGRKYASQTDATRWVERKCPNGASPKSWIALDAAAEAYLFTRKELRKHVASGALISKQGTGGNCEGAVLVLRNQCALLREKLGFTEEQAAARLKITPARLRSLLGGVQWRRSELIPSSAVNAVRKRLESREGFEISEAAKLLKTSVERIEEEIARGSARVSRAPWDRRRRYLTKPMVERLRAALKSRNKLARPTAEDLSLDAASIDSGVSMTTVRRWAADGEIDRVATTQGWRYPRASLRRRARVYWKTARFLRDLRPAWLKAEARAKT